MCFSGLLRRLCFVLNILVAILFTIARGVLPAQPPVDPNNEFGIFKTRFFQPF
jgi:hypothetical protein